MSLSDNLEIINEISLKELLTYSKSYEGFKKEIHFENVELKKDKYPFQKGNKFDFASLFEGNLYFYNNQRYCGNINLIVFDNKL